MSRLASDQPATGSEQAGRAGQRVNQATEPAQVHNGLAIYRRGDGPPLLMFPYPHASGGGPMIDGALASLAVGCGFQVCTFDPPGQYRSTRTSRFTLAEMLDCAAETLDVLGLPGPGPRSGGAADGHHRDRRAVSAPAGWVCPRA